MNDLDILNEFYKIVRMGLDSYSHVAPKVIDPGMKEELSYQYNTYSNILTKVNFELSQRGDIPKDTSIMNKAMEWTGVQMNTLNDKTSSHIADMIIQGSTMGINKSTKLINDNPDMDPSIRENIHHFITVNQRNIDSLKKYL